jgi:hypothetical protein
MKDQFIEIPSDQLGHVSGGFLGALLGLAGPIMNLVGSFAGKKKKGGDQGDQGEDKQLAAATAERDKAQAALAAAQGGGGATTNMMGEGAIPQQRAYG